MTRLRQRMLDELERRNYLPHTIVPTCTLWRRSRRTFTVPRISLDLTTSVSTRFICFVIASSRPAPLKGRLQRCGSCL